MTTLRRFTSPGVARSVDPQVSDSTGPTPGTTGSPSATSDSSFVPGSAANTRDLQPPGSASSHDSSPLGVRLADAPRRCSPMLSSDQKRKLVSDEVARLNSHYDAIVKVIFDDYGEVGVENSSARYTDFLIRIDMDAPISHSRGEALFILRHEYAHAAWSLDEVQADQFAAEWAALEGQPRDELAISVARTEATAVHPPGPERVRACRETYDRVQRDGHGHYAPTLPYMPPRMPDA